jgi:hypothetical protein
MMGWGVVVVVVVMVWRVQAEPSLHSSTVLHLLHLLHLLLLLFLLLLLLIEWVLHRDVGRHWA